MKILIVDDRESIRSLLEHFLKQEGYKDVLFAESAREAFSILKGQEIDLVLLDIMMPEIDGIEACQRIKEEFEKDIPVIMITAKTDKESLKKAFDAGAIDYIQKPFNRIELLARINSAVKLIVKERKLQKTVELLENTNQELEKANQELKMMVSIDGLTQIANRKFFDETLSKEWARAKRKKTPLGLLMIDIDNFKNYNDTYGHQGGDECLKKLAKLFEELAQRPGDLAARYGGEEFAIILAETGLAGVEVVGERVRKEVENLELEHKGSGVSKYVTVSIGAAVAKPKDKGEAGTLIEVADKLLYQAKESGRNQVKVADEVINI